MSRETFYPIKPERKKIARPMNYFPVRRWKTSRPLPGAVRSCLVLLLAWAALGGCHTALRKPAAPSHDTLDHTVMVGYQGWFRTPTDGAGMAWAHYQQSNAKTFGPAHVSVDFWPDTSELPESSRVTTAFTQADGSAARVFSSHDPRVVDLHFRWMQEYGIDGAFVQRFAEPIVFDDAASHTRLRATDDVLRYATAAAELHGRSFAVMYDLSGLPGGAIDRVLRDWRHVVDDLGIRHSTAYQRHRGRPVVAVWGVGFNDHRAYTLDEIATLVTFLKSDPVYGGNTVMLGIPTWWREQTSDAVADPKLHAVLQLADILSPWTPGRYHDLGGVETHAERFWAPDREWCAAHGLDYLPVVFPGFSWRNLKGVSGGISRNDGRFLWAQYRELANRGFTMVYQAMFDEMDEGTQIFKTSQEPPRGAFFETYDPLPSDYYLWLVGTAGDFIRRSTSMPERIVDRRGAPDANRYLRSHDDGVYSAVPAAADAHRRLTQIEDALDHHLGELKSPGGATARVSVSGNWTDRYQWSVDPSATVTWEIDVVAAGDYAIDLRYPGDPNRDHATAARCRIVQDGKLVAEQSVNLSENPLQWIAFGECHLTRNVPCKIVLDQATPSGALVLFEPRLRPLARAPEVKTR